GPMQRDHASENDTMASVNEQASSWWVLLNEGNASQAEYRAFLEWVTRSPDRVAAYLETARLALALRSDKTRWPDTPVEELIREAKASPGEIASLPISSNSPGRDMRRWPLASASGFAMPKTIGPRFAAILVAALAAVATGFYFYLSPQRLETAVGEQRSVILSDGSLVTLNTSSALEVR